MKPAQLLKEYRRRINPPYKFSDIWPLFGTIAILVLIPLTVAAILQVREPASIAAGTATLSLSPPTQSVNQGSNFTVQVIESSTGDTVNAVQANLTYDATKLDFISISSSAAFEVVAQSTGAAGSVVVARGTTTPKTGSQVVATITFRARNSPGVASVNYTTGSAVVSSVDNANMLVSSSGGAYTVVDPPPTVSITSPAAAAVVSGTVTVSATATDDLGVSRVEFSVDSAAAFATDTTAPYSASWGTTTLSNGSHTLRARAFDAAGNSTLASINLTVDNQAPSTPAGLTATVASGTQVNLAWSAATDNVGVTGYDVYRNSAKIATVTGTSYSDSGLTAGTSYSYYVQARDGQGNISTASTTVTATTLKRGDINSDGVVNVFDLSILLSNWQGANVGSDLNNNGIVDIFDLSILLSNWQL